MEGKQTKKELFLEICRFLLVGGTATIADYLVHALLQGVFLPLFIKSEGWQTFLATACGFCAGLFVNWLLSVKFVFQQVKNKEEASSKKSFFLFTVIGVIGLALTEVGVLLLIGILPNFTLFGGDKFLGVYWSTWLSRAIMTCIVLVWNYVGRKLFIFK